MSREYLPGRRQNLGEITTEQDVYALMRRFMREQQTLVPAHADDADTVDGQHAAAFALAGHGHPDIRGLPAYPASLSMLYATAAGAYWDVVPEGGGAGYIRFEFTAGSFYYATLYPAPLVAVVGVNIREYLHLFDSSTEEFVLGDFEIPSLLDTEGEVILTAKGRAITAAADRYIQLRFRHSCIADSEAQDTAYAAAVDSGDHLTDATQGDTDTVEWTAAVSDLGWAAGESCYFSLSRIAPTGTNLAVDWGLRKFFIDIPVSG